MKRLMLVRHAKSSWSDPYAADHDRVLAKPRRTRCATHGGQASRPQRSAGADPEQHGRSRARDRENPSRTSLGFRGTFPETDRELYHADAYTLLDIVRRQDDACSDLMLVGHNPGMTRVVNVLLPEYPLDNLSTSGIVAIDLDIETWQDAEPSAATLAFHDYPKNRAAVPGEDQDARRIRSDENDSRAN